MSLVGPGSVLLPEYLELCLNTLNWLHFVHKVVWNEHVHVGRELLDSKFGRLPAPSWWTTGHLSHRLLT